VVTRFHFAVALGAFSLSVWFASYGTARADFSIIPISVALTPQKATDLLTIHNSGNHQVRLQLNIYKWSQTTEGKPVLTPSDDVVFYPPIVTVDQNEDRIIRVGSAVPFGFVEKTYRVVAEELPPLPEPPKPGETRGQTKVLVLTKMSIPVFLEPPSMVHNQAISSASLQNGTLSFQVRNQGNSHMTMSHAWVEGYGSDNKSLFHRSTVRSNYILGGQYQNFSLDLPNPPCSQLRKLSILVPIGLPSGEYDIKSDTLKTDLSVTPDKCGRGDSRS
jgi:fimbrial chaperone protein